MRLLAFFLLQGLHQQLINRVIFAGRKFWKHLFSERKFHLKFFPFLDIEIYDEATYDSKRLYKLKPLLEHLNAKFMSVYTQECDESLMM
jgi:hypothetical protein